MTYKLDFHPDALDEWKKLPPHIKEQFKKVLKRRLVNPHVPSAHLRGNLKECYKIKLLKAGYRLVYKVNDKDMIVLVIAVGKRKNDYVYDTVEKR